MRVVQILDGEDMVLGTDWCRPLFLCTMSGGHSDHMGFRSRAGTPENNVKWVQTQDILPPVWRGSTAGQINKALEEFVIYEFLRGEIPKEHRLDMSGYSRMGERWNKHV